MGKDQDTARLGDDSSGNALGQVESRLALLEIVVEIDQKGQVALDRRLLGTSILALGRNVAVGPRPIQVRPIDAVLLVPKPSPSWIDAIELDFAALGRG